MRILIIDDDLNTNFYLKQFLVEIKEWEVILESSPKEGLKLIQSAGNQLDAIILDVMMPPDDSINIEASNQGRRTGLLLLEKITELTQSKIPVILLTARQALEEELDELGLNKQVAAYLRKPTSTTEIVNRIEQIVNSRKRK